MNISERELQERAYARLEEDKLTKDEVKEEARKQEEDKYDLLLLKYKPGDKVFDKTSGKKGEIIAGTREVVRIPVSREEGS